MEVFVWWFGDTISFDIINRIVRALNIASVQ